MSYLADPFYKLGYLFVICVFAFLTILTVGTTVNPVFVPRIIGGHDVPDGKYPYIVSLRKPPWRHFCGGSIIHKRWILTAAHCLQAHNKSVTVVAGTNLIKGGEEQTYQSEIIRSHPRFIRKIRISNDIGLIRVSEDIKFNDKVQPIRLPTKDFDKAGYPVTMIGWGVKDTRNTKLPIKLQEISVMILRQCVCKRRSGGGINKSHICTFTNYGEGTCFGDSGGPLVADGVQIGVASFILVGCAEGYPDVYARVYTAMRWIKNVQSKFKD